MGWVTAIASIAAAQQVSAIGKYNQAVQNRNAQVAEQEAAQINKQLTFDLARFDQQFTQLQGQTKTAALKSGVELSGSALKILRYNTQQAEIQKDIMEYNSKVAQNQKLEQANFARIQGTIARQTAKAQAIGLYGQAISTIGTQTDFGKSLLG